MAQVAQKGGGVLSLEKSEVGGWGSEHLVELQVSLFTAGHWIRWPLGIPSDSSGSVVLCVNINEIWAWSPCGPQVRLLSVLCVLAATKDEGEERAVSRQERLHPTDRSWLLLWGISTDAEVLL